MPETTAMSAKHFPLNTQSLAAIVERFPTPFYLYDEAAIRAQAQRITRAFSIFPGFKEHYAVKALPTPFILKILAAEGFGADCASLPELILAQESGAHGRAMGFNYNGKLRCSELLLRPDGEVIQIRRGETLEDYFATLDFDALAAFQA